MHQEVPWGLLVASSLVGHDISYVRLGLLPDMCILLVPVLWCCRLFLMTFEQGTAGMVPRLWLDTPCTPR